MGSQRKIQKKVWGSKQVLSSPFALTFPNAKSGVKEAVLSIFAQHFPEPFARRESRSLRKAPTHVMHPEGVSPNQEMGEQDRKTKEIRKKPKRVICGLNEVTRALEKKTMELVIVSRDVTPSFLITHIPILCYVNSANLVVLSGDGTELGHILGTRRLLALGILKKVSVDSESTQSEDVLLGKLEPYRSTLEYPWLAAIRGEKTPNLPDPSMVPHKTKNDILAPLQKK
ncbi:unnamed protein product [Agarophyton chilense]